MEEIETEEILVHADKSIYSKTVMITWFYNGSKYENVIPLIGGFHTLLVCLNILQAWTGKACNRTHTPPHAPYYNTRVVCRRCKTLYGVLSQFF